MYISGSKNSDSLKVQRFLGKNYSIDRYWSVSEPECWMQAANIPIKSTQCQLYSQGNETRCQLFDDYGYLIEKSQNYRPVPLAANKLVNMDTESEAPKFGRCSALQLPLIKCMSVRCPTLDMKLERSNAQVLIHIDLSNIQAIYFFLAIFLGELYASIKRNTALFWKRQVISFSEVEYEPRANDAWCKSSNG